MKIRAIVTTPPYADFLDEVARHPLVEGFRLNTVMPVKGELAPLLERLSGHGVPLWVDPKARQLRVVGAAIPPYTDVRVSHGVFRWSTQQTGQRLRMVSSNLVFVEGGR